MSAPCGSAGPRDCRRPRTRGGAIPQRQYEESDERLRGRRELSGKIAQHLPSRRSSFPDRTNRGRATAQLHVGAPPGASSQLIRDPISGNGPLTASGCFSRGDDRVGAHQREASACVTSHLKRVAVDLARHRLGKAATHAESAVARLVADRVARRAPTGPFDHEHSARLQRPGRALYPDPCRRRAAPRAASPGIDGGRHARGHAAIL